MALQVLFVVLSTLSLAWSQDDVRQYPAITGAQARRLQLFQNPELRALAARFNERIIIEIDSLESAAIVEEGVNANMDCLPWLSRFPGGTIQWLMRQRDQTGAIVGNAETVMPSDPDLDPPPFVVVGGDFNRWFNISSTLVARAAEDPSFGDYICMVCIGRGTPRQQCHNATLTLHVLGAPPRIDTAVDNEPMIPLESDPNRFSHLIGANFCLDSSLVQRVTLSCPILEVPAAVPMPNRTFVKDGVEIYSGPEGNNPFNDEFLTTGNNALFMLVDPSPFDIMTASDGGITFDTTFNNITMLIEGVTLQNFRELAFNAILGDYTCIVNNVFGSDTAMTNIRRCGIPPQVPTCGVGVETLFVVNGKTAPAGCNVCIAMNAMITLTCNATGTEPLMYRWTGPNEFTSASSSIRVRSEGQYNCTVTNVDNVDGVLRIADVFEIALPQLTPTIIDRSETELMDNGCGRLLGALMPEPDSCLLVGDTFNLSCSAGGMELEVINQDGMTFQGPVTVTDALDGMTFQCTPQSDTPCDVPLNHTVRVFDPARVSRNQVVGPNEIGAGQTTATTMVTENGTVTLACPTSGINDPMSNWTQVIVDVEGIAQEIPIDESDPTFTLSERDGGSTILLTISDYRGVRHDGTYICRTSNIAGRDTAIVALSSTPDTGIWVASEYSECNVDCRDGVRVRSVTCRSRRDGRLLPNIDCLSLTRPASQANCSAIFPDNCFLTPIFVTGPFGPCSQGCRGGFRKRSVECVVPMTGEIRPDFDCFPLRKPNVFRECPNTCCLEDNYSACKITGSRFCNMLSYQQNCCWTCLLRVKPY